MPRSPPHKPFFSLPTKLGIDFRGNNCYNRRTVALLLGVRPMKPLFFSHFAALTCVLLSVAVYAEQYVVRSDVPMDKVVTFREMPTYSVPDDSVAAMFVGEPISIPMPFTAAKPPEMPITLPEPLTLTPFLPLQDIPPVVERTVASPDVVRGQIGAENLGEILRTPAPLAKGPVAEGTIDPKLIEDLALPDSDPDFLEGLPVSDESVLAKSGQSSGTPPTDPLGYGLLVAALILTTLGLIYMAFIAYENHQRWMHSLTSQNDRYLGGGTFDLGGEDLYGGSVSFSDSFGLSDGFGLAHRSI